MKASTLIVNITMLLVPVPGIHATPVVALHMQPVHVTTRENHARKLTHYDIRWCAKEKFKSCAATSLELDVGKCYDLRGGIDNNAESMKKGGGVSCLVYDEKKCEGEPLEVSGDVKRFPDEWKNKISSFKCDDKDGK